MLNNFGKKARDLSFGYVVLADFDPDPKNVSSNKFLEKVHPISEKIKKGFVVLLRLDITKALPKSDFTAKTIILTGFKFCKYLLYLSNNNNNNNNTNFYSF